MASPSEDPAPTSKRPRCTDTPMQIRDPNFYFEDGSIVLAAKDEENIMHFRVHKSILIREAILFKAMFAVPTTLEEEQYDAVPLVVMHDDADDLRAFLKAIYEPHAVFLSRYHKDTAHSLTAPLRLAMKYKAEALRARIISHLQADWPAENYDEWKNRCNMLGEKINTHPKPEHLVYLVRVTNAPSDLDDSLAMAYYQLSCYKTSAYESHLLDAKDFRKLIFGRSNVTNWIIRSFQGGTNGDFPVSGCERCRTDSFRFRLLSQLLDPATPDVLLYLEREVERLATGLGAELCSRKCRREMSKWLGQLPKRFYKKLPEFFGYDWGDLLASDSDDSDDSD